MKSSIHGLAMKNRRRRQTNTFFLFSFSSQSQKTNHTWTRDCSLQYEIGRGNAPRMEGLKELRKKWNGDAQQKNVRNGLHTCKQKILKRKKKKRGKGDDDGGTQNERNISLCINDDDFFLVNEQIEQAQVLS